MKHDDNDISCDYCGYLIKPTSETGVIPIKIRAALVSMEDLYFHDKKCHALWRLKQARQNKIRRGKREDYGATSI